MKWIRGCVVAILVIALLASFAVPASAAKLTAAEYADLFERASGFSEEDPLPELEKAFLADPMGFVKALAKEDYHTMFNVRFVTLNGADWASDPERYAHRDALLRIAYGEKLTQPERRVVSYMLSSTKILKDYVIYTDKIDYTELFSRVQESDTNSSSQISTELLRVFDRDPKAFLQAAGKIEEQDTVLRVVNHLAYDHYYCNYDREKVEKAINKVKDSADLSIAMLQVIQKFWEKVDEFVYNYGPLPTRPTTPPSTQPTTVPNEKPRVSVDKQTYYQRENVTFAFSGVAGRSFTLHIVCPDGREEKYPMIGSLLDSSATPSDSKVMSFSQVGQYQARISAAYGLYDTRYSESIRFQVTVAPATEPANPAEPDLPRGEPTTLPVIWVVIGIVVVALGSQVVAVVLYKKKGSKEE